MEFETRSNSPLIEPATNTRLESALSWGGITLNVE